MINKSRDFSTLLDELLEADADVEREEISAPSVAFDILSVVEELGQISVTDKAAADEYDAMSSPRSQAELDALFAALGGSEPEASIDPADISRELGLQAGARPDDLARLRRSFAFRNHPDRVAPHLRERALIRMKVANMLIDEAQQKVAAQPVR